MLRGDRLRHFNADHNLSVIDFLQSLFSRGDRSYSFACNEEDYEFFQANPGSPCATYLDQDGVARATRISKMERLPVDRIALVVGDPCKVRDVAGLQEDQQLVICVCTDGRQQARLSIDEQPTVRAQLWPKDDICWSQREAFWAQRRHAWERSLPPVDALRVAGRNVFDRNLVRVEVGGSRPQRSVAKKYRLCLALASLALFAFAVVAIRCVPGAPDCKLLRREKGYPWSSAFDHQGYGACGECLNGYIAHGGHDAPCIAPGISSERVPWSRGSLQLRDIAADERPATQTQVATFEFVIAVDHPSSSGTIMFTSSMSCSQAWSLNQHLSVLPISPSKPVSFVGFLCNGHKSGLVALAEPAEDCYVRVTACFRNLGTQRSNSTYWEFVASVSVGRDNGIDWGLPGLTGKDNCAVIPVKEHMEYIRAGAYKSSFFLCIVTCPSRGCQNAAEPLMSCPRTDLFHNCHSNVFAYGVGDKVTIEIFDSMSVHAGPKYYMSAYDPQDPTNCPCFLLDGAERLPTSDLPSKGIETWSASTWDTYSSLGTDHSFTLCSSDPFDSFRCLRIPGIFKDWCKKTVLSMIISTRFSDLAACAGFPTLLHGKESSCDKDATRISGVEWGYIESVGVCVASARTRK